MLNKTVALAILLVYIGLITFLSLTTLDTHVDIKVDYGDKIVHIAIHAINVILLYIVLIKYNSVKPILFAIIISVCYGILIEILQEKLTSARQFDKFDIYANCFGTIIAAVFLKIKGRAIVKLI